MWLLSRCIKHEIHVDDDADPSHICLKTVTIVLHSKKYTAYFRYPMHIFDRHLKQHIKKHRHEKGERAFRAVIAANVHSFLDGMSCTDASVSRYYRMAPHSIVPYTPQMDRSPSSTIEYWRGDRLTRSVVYNLNKSIDMHSCNLSFMKVKNNAVVYQCSAHAHHILSSVYKGRDVFELSYHWVFPGKKRGGQTFNDKSGTMIELRGYAYADDVPKDEKVFSSDVFYDSFICLGVTRDPYFHNDSKKTRKAINRNYRNLIKW